MKITIIGTGYVGLVTGTCLADMGNDVMCLDMDEHKIAMLKRGEIPIYEPGLKELVESNASAGRLRFTTDIRESVMHGAVQFIAVGTPPGEDGSADLQYVVSAARNIGRYMVDYKVVVDKSTVPVGTAAEVVASIESELALRGIEGDFDVVSNPEFLKEGAAIKDFMTPDRVIVGAEDPRAMQVMRTLYAPFVRNRDRLLFMSVRSAEFTKYAANAMLATRISFMNELALVAETLGVDIEMVRQGIGSDPRIGPQFLYAGCGFGGSCFPKDIKALRRTAEASGHRLRMLEAVDEINERQKQVLVDKIVRRLGPNLNGMTFAMWGLAFKPNTNDMREAPSLVVIEQLLGRGAKVVAYDPVASEEAQKVLPRTEHFHIAGNRFSALDGADALVIVTEWKEFRSLDVDELKGRLRTPLVFDGRNLYDPSTMEASGIEYFPIGRGGSQSATPR